MSTNDLIFESYEKVLNEMRYDELDTDLKKLLVEKMYESGAKYFREMNNPDKSLIRMICSCIVNSLVKMAEIGQRTYVQFPKWTTAEKYASLDENGIAQIADTLMKRVFSALYSIDEDAIIASALPEGPFPKVRDAEARPRKDSAGDASRQIALMQKAQEARKRGDNAEALRLMSIVDGMIDDEKKAKSGPND
jgi:hypothetical protein